MGMRRSRAVAWGEVRGKPSRMKEVEGSEDGETCCCCSCSCCWEGETGSFSSPGEAVAAAATSEGGVEVGVSQLREVSSERMRERMRGSGTREPDRIREAAWRPACINDLVRKGD